MAFSLWKHVKTSSNSSKLNLLFCGCFGLSSVVAAASRVIGSSFPGSWWGWKCSSRYQRIFKTGWWFGTFFIFPCIGNNHPNWLIFFRGVAQPPTSKTIDNHSSGGYIPTDVSFFAIARPIKVNSTAAPNQTQTNPVQMALRVDFRSTLLDESLRQRSLPMCPGSNVDLQCDSCWAIVLLWDLFTSPNIM